MKTTHTNSVAGINGTACRNKMNQLKSLLMGLCIAASLSVGSTANASFVHVGYSFADGANLLFGIKNFVVGAALYSASYSQTDSLGTNVSVSASQQEFKFGWYSNGLGTSSWYGTAGIGTMGFKGTGNNAAGISVAGETSAQATTFLVGRHFFWGFFDLKLGIGMTSWSGWGDFNIKSNGVTLSSVPKADLPTSFPGIDLGIGLNF